MSTFTDRSGPALLVVDVQQDVVEGAYERERVVTNIVSLVSRAREQRVPVVWVAHHDAGLEQGSDGWQYVPELVRAESEPLVHKCHGDAFEDTDLEDVLARVATGHLVVAGAETDACIRSTIHGAFTRGYDVTLVADAHTAGDRSEWGAPPPEQVVAHTNLYWGFQSAPGRTAAVQDAAEIAFGR